MHLVGRHAFEPVWQPRRRLLGRNVPELAAQWLFDSSSLTRRVCEACAGRFRVDVLSQHWGRPMFNEARRLGLADRSIALIRQVHLLCDEQPWVFARTVIPRRTLSGPRRYLTQLGSRPLGAVLFADPSMRRDEVEVACIRPGQYAFDLATHKLDRQPRCIWGRRSVFFLERESLLVSEIFLPALVPCEV